MRKNIVYLIIFLFGFFLFWQFFIKKNNTPEITKIDLPQKTVAEVEENLNIVLPTSGEKIVLFDETNSSINAIAIKDQIDNNTSISILADLTEDKNGYSAFLINSQNEEILIGNLTFGKGGYYLDYQFNNLLDEFNKIVVKSSDNVVLKGEFELN